MPLPVRSSFAPRLAPLWLAVAFTGFSILSASAGTDASAGKAAPAGVQQVLDEVTPLNEFNTETSYVGVAPFKEKEFRSPGPLAPDGRQTNYQNIDTFQTGIDFAHRFHLFDQVYLKLGASYERFDFGQTDAPLPTTLQSLNGVVALEYLVRGNVAAFLTTSPGVYFSQTGSLGPGNVDAPTAVGTSFKVPCFKGVYGLAGTRFSALAKYPVFPIAGLIWVIRDDLLLKLIPPDPRLVYSLNDHVDLVVGAELLGESYKRDFNDDYRPQFKKFSGGVIDYSETRIGGGVTIKLARGLAIDLRGGWDLGRTFDYHRGDSKRFRTDGAPYAKLALGAEF